jgi:F-type H+-transporting ATPase subunit delta
MLGAPRHGKTGHSSSSKSKKFSSLFKDLQSVDNSGGISASLAGRYATALFALAQEKKAVATVEASMQNLQQALTESPEFAALTTNGGVPRAAAKAAVAGVAKALKLDPLSSNLLGVLAENRRLSETNAVAAAFGALATNFRGEVTANVVSARALSAAQQKALSAQLKKRVGSDVKINSTVDPSILGGLTIIMGSQMIDSSIKTRLNSLATAMKG